MKAKLEQAKSENKTLKVSYTTVLFSGSSGVGKTSLLNKLNKEQLNEQHHSTGIAKSKHTICIKTIGLFKSAAGLQWIDLDYDSMISYLHEDLRNMQLQASIKSTEGSSPKKNAPKTNVPNKNTSSHLNKQPHNNVQSTGSFQKHKAQITTENVSKINVEDDIANADSSGIPSLGDIWDIINFLDTGGQPEFINILPAVSSSIALTFIVFNLSKCLDNLVHVEHNVNGDPSFEPYYLDCTNLEFIKRLMVSSENFNKNITPLFKLNSIPREDGENDSKICYIGTHALNVSEKDIRKIDNQLSIIASELNLHCRTFWCSPTEQLQTLFPIDLFPVDKESYEEIIEHIRNKIQMQVQGRDYYEVPITWFIFLLKLQKLCHVNKVNYISYQEAVDVWMDGKNELEEIPVQTMDDLSSEHVSRDNSDVHNILLFFHFMGMLFYYHEVEGMRDFVFVDRQWLFEKLTELVEIKFKGYTILNKMSISAEDVKTFKMEGRLNANIIKNLKIDLQGIQPLHFIHLLDYLNIVAPIDSKLKEYFMPCVLPSFQPANPSQQFVDLDKIYGDIQHVPLLVGFKNGPMPHGFFCHVIVNLFKNLPTSWVSPLLPSSGMRHIYNNLITFPTTSGHAVSLFYKIGYLEIQVRHRKTCSTIIHSDVQHKLDAVIKKVSDHLQLNKEQLCYGFYCKCKEHHFTKLEEFTSSTEYIFCGYDYYEVTEDHKVWWQVTSYMCVHLKPYMHDYILCF